MGDCVHANIHIDSVDQTWGITCCDCNTLLAADWEPEHVVPPELEARELAQRPHHLCNRDDCLSKSKVD